jgi:hypothetical protein
LKSGLSKEEMIPKLVEMAEDLTTKEVLDLIETKPERLVDLLSNVNIRYDTTISGMVGIVLALIKVGHIN